MKNLLCAIALLAIVGILFIGCSDNSEPPVQSSQNILQKPGNGEGAGILRYEAENAYGFIDEEAHLMLVLGINNFTDFCTGSGGMDIFKFKELLLPNADPELRRDIFQMSARDVTAVIWQADEWPEDFCDFVLSHDPLAVGTANFTNTDNDFNAWWQDNPNANAFGYKANGSLTSVSGKLNNFNFFERITWDGVETIYMQNVKIHLVPKGN